MAGDEGADPVPDARVRRRLLHDVHPPDGRRAAGADDCAGRGDAGRAAGDGRSRGVTLGELAALMKDFGASDALNLDGDGSTARGVRDAVTGAYAVANRPSERGTLGAGLDSVGRPVVDWIGVDVAGE
jgi:hypothetical protein